MAGFPQLRFDFVRQLRTASMQFLMQLTGPLETFCLTFERNAQAVFFKDTVLCVGC